MSLKKTSLRDLLPVGRVSDRLIDRLAYAHDASIYRFVPEAVVRPANEEEVIRLLAFARTEGKSVTFRAGGTSLSGQSVTDGIIAETVRDWKRFEILDGGTAIKLEPGIVGDHANRSLRPYCRRIGPDPASIKAAMIGGIISNNASGMACGIQNNSYHTLRHIRFILANGNTYDTSLKQDYDRFLRVESELAGGLRDLRQHILHDQSIVNRIRHKYRLKNTLGYSINAFLDYEHPLDIFSHLLVGAEGTLAFISNITLNTIPDPPCKTTGLLLFESMNAACAIIPTLKALDADAVELMDYASLSTARYFKDPPYDFSAIKPGSGALLCEFQGEAVPALTDAEKAVENKLPGYHGIVIGGFRSGERERSKLWQLRKGLYPTVGALRRVGTSVITEDICFDNERLADAVTDLQQLFVKWKYDDAVIFGHAKDGNLHFVASIDLDSRAGVARYEGLMKDMVEMTVGKYDGSLKAEHGTGRNMAPFVEYEWGGELCDVMWRVKRLADPQGILNPGVLLNKDQRVHIKSLKPLPKVDDIIDLCVECGFCEPVCPSRELTLTPRQRIVLTRELALVDNDPEREELLRDYLYYGDLTCAVDGLCETACPVNINIGLFVKEQRFNRHTRAVEWLADRTVNHFGWVQRMARFGLAVTRLKTGLLGHNIFIRLSTWANKNTNRSFPVWNKYIPGRAPKIRRFNYGKGQPYVYYTSCLNRVFAATENRDSLPGIMGEIAEYAGVRLIIPRNIDRTCCGTPYGSKGYSDANKTMLGKTVKVLYEVTMGGEYPVVVDTSPCTYQFIHVGNSLTGEQLEKWKHLKFIDIIPFLFELVKGEPKPKMDRDIVLHPTCSTKKMGMENLMEKVAHICARTVIVPEYAGCCGFAGDRGLLIPELTVAATRHEAESLEKLKPDYQGYSTSRTCEIGMMSATDRIYESIAVLVRDYLSQ